MPDLYPEDQERVNKYLSSSVHQVERKPFNPWRILLGVAIILVVFTGIGYLVARNHGVM